jgi:hypothetical protein
MSIARRPTQQTTSQHVFSLSVDAAEVEAFSMWKEGAPFIFLNTGKSAEHGRFDAAHELGHLVLHRHEAPSGREADRHYRTLCIEISQTGISQAGTRRSAAGNIAGLGEGLCRPSSRGTR